MQRRDFLKTAAVGTAAAVFSPAALAAEPTAEQLAKKLPRWRGFNLLEKFTAGGNKPFVEDDFRWIADWGFDFVRLPLDYRCWTDAAEPYKLKEKVLAEIDQAVEFGRKHKVHVNVNLHRAPGYCVNPPAEKLSLWTDEEAQKQFDFQWASFAKRYKGIPSTQVSFDLLNEPANLDAGRLRQGRAARRGRHPQGRPAAAGHRRRPELGQQAGSRAGRPGHRPEHARVSAHGNQPLPGPVGQRRAVRQAHVAAEARQPDDRPRVAQEDLHRALAEAGRAGRGRPRRRVGRRSTRPRTTWSSAWPATTSNSGKKPAGAGPSGTSAAPSASSTAAAPTWPTKISTGTSSIRSCWSCSGELRAVPQDGGKPFLIPHHSWRPKSHPQAPRRAPLSNPSFCLALLFSTQNPTLILPEWSRLIHPQNARWSGRRHPRPRTPHAPREGRHHAERDEYANVTASPAPHTTSLPASRASVPNRLACERRQADRQSVGRRRRGVGR